MALDCEIPYIDNNPRLNTDEKDSYTKKHAAVVKALKALTKDNLSDRSRQSTVNGKLLKYISVSSNQKDGYQAIIDTTSILLPDDTTETPLSDYIKIVPGPKNDNIILVDVLKDTVFDVTQGDFDYNKFIENYEQNLYNYSTDSTVDQNLTNVLSNTQNREKLYEFFGEFKSTIENLLRENNVSNSQLGNQLKALLKGMDNNTFLYSAETAHNYLIWASKFSKTYKGLFTKKDSLQNQLKNLDILESYDERKQERYNIAKQLDQIKNKYYVFSKLNEFLTQLELRVEDFDNIYDTYNKYAIQAALEKKVSEPLLAKLKVAMAAKITSKEDLIDIILNESVDNNGVTENILLEFTRDELNTIIKDSVFKALQEENGTIKEPLSKKIFTTVRDLDTIQKNTKDMIIDTQVDLLFDAYTKFQLKLENPNLLIPGTNKTIFDEYLESLPTYNRSKILTKQKIKDSILNVNGNTGYLGYGLGRYTEIDDTLIALTTELLDQTISAADVEQVFSSQQMVEDFKDYHDVVDEFSEDLQTYSFDFAKYNPEVLESRGNRIVYTKKIKNNGIYEDKEFEVDLNNITPLYERFYKLNPENDNEWAYLADNGIYYKVLGTKAIKGLNQNMRIKLEQRIHQANIEINVEKVMTAQKGYGYYKDVINKDDLIAQAAQNNTVDFDLRKSIKGKLWKAFKDRYTPDKELEDKKELKQDLYRKLENEKQKSIVDKLVKDNTSRISVITKQDQEKLKASTKSLNTSIIRYNGKVLLKYEDKSFPEFVEFKDINYDAVKYYYVEGSTFTTIVADEVFDNERKELKQLKNKPKFADFYTLVTDAYKKLQDNDHTGFLNNGKLGQIVTKEKLSQLDLVKLAFKGDFKKVIDDILRSSSKDTQQLNVDGLDIDNLSPAFSNRIDNQDYVSNNLFVNLMGMTTQAIQFENMYQLEPNMKFALLLNKGQESLKIGERNTSSKSKKSRISLVNNAKQALRTLDFVVKSKFYNDSEVKDAFLKDTFLDKALDKVKKLTRFQQLALNVGGPLRNLVLGQVNNYILAVSTKYNLDKKVVTDSYKYIKGNITEIMASAVGHRAIKDSHYLVKIAHLFQGISGMEVQSKNYFETKDPYDHYLNTSTLYGLYTSGEILNQLPLMMGFMKSYKLPSGQSMYDAVNIGGQPIGSITDNYGKVSITDNGQTVSKEIIADFILKLQKLKSSAHGDYGKFDNKLMHNEVLPSMALTFSKWLYPYIKDRYYVGVRFDQDQAKDVYSGYQSNFLLNQIAAWHELKEMAAFVPNQPITEQLLGKVTSIGKKVGVGLGKGVVRLPLYIFSAFNADVYNNKDFQKYAGVKDKAEVANFFNVVQLKDETQEEYNIRVDNAFEQYIGGLKQASLEYTYFMAFTLLGLVAAALADEDDEDPTFVNKLLQVIDVQSSTLANEIALATPFVAPLKTSDFFTQKAKDPFNMIRTITLNGKVLNNLLGFQVNLAQGSMNFNVDDRYDKSGIGYEKDDLKIMYNLKKSLFAPYYQIIKFSNPVMQDKINKLINQGALVTDKDLESVNDNSVE